VTGGDPASPCINICVLDPASGYCRGCWRTLDEITGWPTASSEEKRRILLILEGRRLTAARTPSLLSRALETLHVPGGSGDDELRRISMDGALTRPRPVARLVRGMPASDGAGVKLNRLIGTPQLPDVDPFLMLDEFRSDDANDYIAGFPDHPHRGFETVTYMIAGRMRHGDNKGHTGRLDAGSVQWMTAGRGIIHSEMPEQENGLMQGFQLWVNLPAKDKMTAPRYQEIAPAEIRVATLPGEVKVKVIAGTIAGHTGPINGIATDPVLLDLALPAGGSVALPLPRGHAAFLYSFEGEAAVAEAATRVAHGSIAVLGEGDGVLVSAPGGAVRVLLAAGRPLKEPIARYGPFVMNTPEQIGEAILDFQLGRF
jgi:quercetin 2,3-dioxygenase